MGRATSNYTAQKMKFSIKDFFSKCNQIRSFLRICSHLLKKSLMENFIFCAVLVGGAVYISSCQHTEKKIWKENYVAWIALEPWLGACPCMPLTRVFQVRVGGFPLSGGGWEILLGRLIYMMVDTWGEVILTIWAFFKARHNIL